MEIRTIKRGDQRRIVVVRDILKDGLYSKYVKLDKDLRGITRSYSLWLSINTRVNTRSDYKNSRNYFNNFQEFAIWCNMQYGYYNIDSNGELWALDKDILGGHVYSPDNCLFVPRRVNNFFLSSKKIRGDYPIGVSKIVYPSGNTKFSAHCKFNSKGITLGKFTNVEDAHVVWQKEKLRQLDLMLSDEELVKHSLLIKRLEHIRQRLEDSITNGLIIDSLLEE